MAAAPSVGPREAGQLDARPAQGAAAASVWVVDAAAREPASAAQGARAAVEPGFLAQASGAALEPGVLTPVAGHSDVEREGQAVGVAQSELRQAAVAERMQDAAVAVTPVAGAAGRLRMGPEQADEPAVGRALVGAVAGSSRPADAAVMPRLLVGAGWDAAAALGSEALAGSSLGPVVVL